MFEKKLVLFSVILLMISALSAQRIPKNYQKKYTLEVLTKITPELYVDKQDLRNIDWLEYMFWLENVYGENSPEYLASMPDTSIFRQQLPADLVRIYKWDGPGYRLFPVLGSTMSRQRPTAPGARIVLPSRC